MLEITRSASPVFISSKLIDVVLVPKSMSPRLVTRFGTGAPTPLPSKPTVTTGLRGSLLPIAKDPLAGPTDNGAKPKRLK